MAESKRNQRYFIRGKGEAVAEEMQKIDVGMDSYISAPETDSLEKTAAEKETILWLSNEVGRVASLYGAYPRNFKPEYVHVFEEEQFSKIKEKVGLGSKIVMAHGLRGIVSDEKFFRGISSLDSINYLTHEFFHAFSVNKYSFDAPEIEGESTKLDLRTIHRSGLHIWHGSKLSKQRGELLRLDRFGGLNEAVTQELTRLFYGRVIRKSEKFKDLVGEFDRENPAEDSGGWIFPEVLKNAYGWLVYLFLDLCKKIKESQPERFEDLDAVTDEFFKVYFSGEIKTLKPILDIVGPECFSDLSDIGSSDNMDDLEKVRKFRKKYNLPDDYSLEKLIEKAKEEEKKS